MSVNRRKRASISVKTATDRRIIQPRSRSGDNRQSDWGHVIRRWSCILISCNPTTWPLRSGGVNSELYPGRTRTPFHVYLPICKTKSYTYGGLPEKPMKLIYNAGRPFYSWFINTSPYKKNNAIFLFRVCGYILVFSFLLFYLLIYAAFTVCVCTWPMRYALLWKC